MHPDTRAGIINLPNRFDALHLKEFLTVKLSRRLMIAAVGCLLVSGVAAAADKSKVLFLTQSQGFKHGSVNRDKRDLAVAEVAMTQLGQKTGLFDIHCTQDAAADFTKENLKNYDIVMFYTTGELPIAAADRDYFMNEWLKQKGHGWIGFHSAADTYRTNNPAHKWYWDLCGGTFKGHPWNAGELVTISVHDTKHPAMKPFGDEFQIKDEIYWYDHWVPENVHVLMSLNIAKCPTKGQKTNDGLHAEHVPVSWCRTWGDGKIFFNNLGHNESTWTDPRFLDSTEAAIRWIRGEVAGDATPNPEVSRQQQAKALKDAGVEK
ncbi:MAG: ThuA domain-containing protein [Planctomycetes bacterium]|nr:ThuA domain-containing protein [Planctomycetota bacterium]